VKKSRFPAGQFYTFNLWKSGFDFKKGTLEAFQTVPRVLYISIPNKKPAAARVAGQAEKEKWSMRSDYQSTAVSSHLNTHPRSLMSSSSDMHRIPK